MREIEMRMQPTQVSDIHTSKGNQLKWEQDGYWYKADAFGYESLAEVVCSNILMHSNLPQPVCYEPVTIIYHDKRYRGCRSKNFKGEDESLIPVERLCRQYTGMGLAKTLARFVDVRDRISYTVELVTNITGLSDFDRYLTQILELDAFFLNEDRHTNNIAVIRNEEDGSFRFCPVFDNGLSLLSDLNDYPLDKDLYECIGAVQAKPFSTDFSEQTEAASQLYGSRLKFSFTKEQLLHKLQELRDYYDDEIVSRVERTVLEQMRRYGYLF